MYQVTRKLVALLALLLCSIGFTGCWDRNEVENISIVLGVLVDTAPDGKTTLMVQVLNPNAIAGGGNASGSSGGGGSIPWRNYATEADKLFLAGRELARQSSPVLYFAQNQVIVISEEAARNKGLAEFIDYFERNSQFRRTNWVFIFKGDEPKKLFDYPTVLQITPVRRIAVAARESAQIGEYSATNLGELLNMILIEGMEPTIGGLQIVPNRAYVKTEIKDVLGWATEKHNLLFDGTAVFKKSKLVGWLEGHENRGFLWISNKMESGVLEIPFGGDDEKVVLEIIKSNTKLETVIDNGSVTVNLKIKTLASVVESESNQDYRDPTIVKALGEQARDRITEDIRSSLEKVQGEYRSDVFGFGYEISKKYPKVWKEVKDSWDDEVFPYIQVKPVIDVVIRDSGLIGNSVGIR